MDAEIISIGSELLLGQIIDTNSSYIAKRLSEIGVDLVKTTAVGDDLQRIKQVIREAIAHSQVVITTGGIGPTEDDLTREAIGELFGRPLVFQQHLMDQIESLFKKRGFRMSENNRKQAFIPEGAIPIENPKGTAPGFIVDFVSGCIISIPGVPSEMEYLMGKTVIPFIKERFGLKNQVIKYKVLRCCGLGESAIGQQIKDLMKESKNPTVGTLASIGDIKIRITAKGESSEEAQLLIEKMEKEIRNRLGILIYGVDEETLHGNVAHELENLKLTLSTVETLTGGIISQKLTSTESRFFTQGIILPSSSSQRQFLNITEDRFNSLNDDPQKITELLATKAREDFNTDLTLATFSRTIEKKTKKEYQIINHYCLSTPNGIENINYTLGGELDTIRERASIIALDIVRKYLLKIKNV